MPLVNPNIPISDAGERLELKTIFYYKNALNPEMLSLRSIFLLKWKKDYSRILAFNKESIKVYDKIFDDEQKAEEEILNAFGSRLNNGDYKIDWFTAFTNPDIMNLLIDIPVNGDSV
jgi:hypothetical protein